MTHDHSEKLELEDVPAEEGITGEDAEEQLAQAPEEKPNFPDTHPDESGDAREQPRGGNAAGG